ncbi:MAG: hypothetical protein MRK02_02205 [Candidatus Scalindua sp.]|nr:hypothetical protein [Candidatus Scalindua sp.]
MKKKTDSVKLQREIRLKIGEKYLKPRDDELKDLEVKFGHLRKKKVARPPVEP